MSALLVMTSMMPLQAQVREDRETPYTMHYSWVSSSDGIRGEGLFFFDNSALGISSGYLIETPGNRRIVLKGDLAVQHGWNRVKLRDDDTGWWVEILEQYELRAPGLADFNHQALEWFVPGKGRTLVMRMGTRGGLDFAHEIAVGANARNMHVAFVKELEAAGVAQQLSAEIPDGFSEVIAFLDAAFEGHNMRNVVDVLAEVASDATGEWGYIGLGWKETESFRQRGVHVSSPELLDFTSKFGSIDARNPLGDQPLEALRQEPPAPLSSPK